jgi:hypothetical protein
MWFRANRMAVNVSKTKYIIFKSRGKKVNLGDDEGIFFNNNDIGGDVDQGKIYKLDRIFDDNTVPQDRSYKLLGVLLDENLSFNHHINYLANKLLNLIIFCLNLKICCQKRPCEHYITPWFTPTFYTAFPYIVVQL